MKNDLCTPSRLVPDESIHMVKENFSVKPSVIHGLGLFSKRMYRSGTELGIALVHKSWSRPFEPHLGDYYRTDLDLEWSQLSATRYLNHSGCPNLALYKRSDHLIVARCMVDIYPGDEITVDYSAICPVIGMDTPDYCVVAETTSH